MILTGKEDLRVQKTVGGIRRSFRELLLEKPFEKITVTELAARAKINKKTFYVYYSDINELLTEMQTEISQAYIKRVGKYRLPEDAAEVIREFFIFSEEQGELYEKITCGGSFQYIRGRMIKNVTSATLRDFADSLVNAYVSAALLEIYKYWIDGGKKMPVEEIIAAATNLICNGLNGVYGVNY